ncbi:MAG: 30S ribosomal protein S17 [Chloroflexi bacterium]|nr:30S ribosomal protein S17 [Chloroflexota bacterium]
MVQAERQVNRKRRTGTVVSSKNDKTVIVAVSRAARHRLYRKVIRQTKRYAVHDPENLATVGDLVTIEESRPVSKTKRWRLVEVMTEREVAEVAPEVLDEALVDEMQRTAARAAAEAGEVGGAGADAEARAATAEPEPEAPQPEAPQSEAPQPEATEAEAAADGGDEGEAGS